MMGQELISELRTIALSTMNTKLITEFDSNSTTKTRHYVKRQHKLRDNTVGISVWQLEMKRMNQLTETNDLLEDIQPYEFGVSEPDEDLGFQRVWELYEPCYLEWE